MCSASLLLWLFLGAADPAASQVTVYRFRDAQGTEHFVDQSGQVPPGVVAEPMNLENIPLNAETARGLEAASRAATARREAAAKQATPGRVRAPPPPPEARRFAVWSAALSLTFLGLTLLRSLVRRGAPQLGVALGTVRFAAGSLALMGWAATAYYLRDSRSWLTERIPPLQALEKARATTDRVQKQQQEMERQIDRSLRGQ